MKPETKKQLEHWLGQASWHTTHSLDEARFYDFVIQAFRDDEKPDNIDDAVKKKLAASMAGLTPEEKEEIAERYHSCVRELYAFLRHIKFK